MGPKRQGDKDSTTGEDNDMAELLQLREKLQMAEQENAMLAGKLRSQEEHSVHQRDELVQQYQQRINDINIEKDRQINTLALENNSLRESVSSRNNINPEGSTSVPTRHYSDRRHYEVPLPRQLLFDGKNSWESFIHPFEAMVVACKWDDQEKLFRLKNSLRGEAAEYAFRQLTSDSLGNFQKLKSAMETRFMEKRSTSSYLAELESRRFNKEKEQIAEYVADIKRLVIKGYPTADNETRETINLRHFLKGLLDSQAALFIGMKEPKSIDEARDLLETYGSLREEVKGGRVRNVDSKSQQDFITEARLQEFGKEMKSSICKKIDNLANLVKSQEKEKGKKSRPDKKNIECFKCHELGHYASKCPSGSEKESSAEVKFQEN